MCRGSAWREGLGGGVPVVDAGFFVTLQYGRDGVGDGLRGGSGMLQQAAEEVSHLGRGDGRCFFFRRAVVPTPGTRSPAATV